MRLHFSFLMFAVAALMAFLFLPAGVVQAAASGQEAISMPADAAIFPPVLAATIVEVIDGDTLRVFIPVYPPGLKVMDIRVTGMDTPEKKDRRPEVRALAFEAKSMAEKLCPPGMEVALSGIKKGSFFRLVAYVNCDGQDLSQTMLDLRLAKPYDGKTKEPW